MIIYIHSFLTKKVNSNNTFSSAHSNKFTAWITVWYENTSSAAFHDNYKVDRRYLIELHHPDLPAT
ncbi:MAG: hypothetical protein ACTS85_02295 [Arsenophonus sp. NC-PG7-MAG3]